MNSQQELLDAINTIAQSKDKSCDTPATVLRVEGDTVWVHIDGGADETPVQKTINCSEGETVQVRISNGSAFLVGNASAPPTDDKTANVAHFIAEEADIKAVRAENTATEAQETAEEAMTAVAQSLTTYETWYILSATTPTQPTEESHTGWSTVEPAWSSTSTDNLYFSVRTVKGDGTATWSAVGMVQSYADLQILKNAIISTVASEYVAQGDSNVTELSSTMLQNENGVNIYNDTLAVGDSYAHIDGDSFDIKEVTSAGVIDDVNDEVVASFGQTTIIGKEDECHVEISDQEFSIYNALAAIAKIDTYGLSVGLPVNNWTRTDEYSFSANEKTGMTTGSSTYINSEHIQIRTNKGETGDGLLIIKATGIYDGSGNKISPTILTSSTISASTTSYTFSNSAITTSSVIDIYDTIFGFAPTNMSTSAGRCTITFPAQSSSHQIKLFIY